MSVHVENNVCDTLKQNYGRTIEKYNSNVNKKKKKHLAMKGVQSKRTKYDTKTLLKDVCIYAANVHLYMVIQVPCFSG